MNADTIIEHVTALAMEAIQDCESSTGDTLQRLEQEIDRIQEKKVAVIDSYFSREITKADMQAMNCKYDSQLKELRIRQANTELLQRENPDSKPLCTAIQSEISGILNGEIESEVFYKSMLDRLIVFKDRHIELQFNCLPHVLHFEG